MLTIVEAFSVFFGVALNVVNGQPTLEHIFFSNEDDIRFRIICVRHTFRDKKLVQLFTIVAGSSWNCTLIGILHFDVINLAGGVFGKNIKTAAPAKEIIHHRLFFYSLDDEVGAHDNRQNVFGHWFVKRYGHETVSHKSI